MPGDQTVREEGKRRKTMTWLQLGELLHHHKNALPLSFTCMQKNTHAGMVSTTGHGGAAFIYRGYQNQKKMLVLCSCAGAGGQLRVVHCSPGAHARKRSKSVKLQRPFKPHYYGTFSLWAHLVFIDMKTIGS